jgi:beta-1,4-mannosyl-glycoprotein beta-1,4-N-acetylglucosaminyltransferase
MYFDEDMVLDIRLNTLDKYVTKFIICEANFNHNGKKKKLKFDINKFKKFKDKIQYIILEEQPLGLKTINKNDSIHEKNSKTLDNALMRENYQRNFCLQTLKKFSEDDLIIINDLDEIPNLKKFKYENKITIFKQNMFYYKFNLRYPNLPWMGSKICKIKHLKSPQWLRNIKPRKYLPWRIDILFSKKKFFNVGFIQDGGWHFTNMKSAEQLDHKMRNFLHHLEYEESGLNTEDLKKLIKEKKIMYNHNADKKKLNKWKNSVSLEKINTDMLPDYIKSNRLKFKNWIE